jgi:predicted nucleic acid-binding protein
MAQPRLRVALDANVLIAGVLLPRWPYEVMRAALQGLFDVVLPEQVVTEARRHLPHPAQQAALDSFLTGSAYEELAMPSWEQVQANLDLVRSEKDVPIVLALLEGRADIFVTNDRDFTDPEATADRFQRQVRVRLTALFLREVLGWSPEALEIIRHRRWEDVVIEADSEPKDT